MDEPRDIEQAKPKRKAKRAPRAFPGLAHCNARAQRRFLLAFAKTGNVSRAAVAARVQRRTHTNWLHAEGVAGEAYRLAFAEAGEMAADLLEDEAQRRAVRGLVRYRFSKDGTPLLHPKTKKPYYELEYSDNLLRDLLRGNRPEKYRDRSKDALSVDDVVRLITALTGSIKVEVLSMVLDADLANRLLASIQAHVSRALALPDVAGAVVASEPAPAADAPAIASVGPQS